MRQVYDWSGLTVLCIAPDGLDRALLAEMLERIGFGRVRALADRPAAEADLPRLDPDIVVVEDASAEAVRLLQAVRIGAVGSDATVPIVSVAADDSAEIAALRDAGVTEVVTRPLTPRRLFRALQLCVDHPRPFIDCAAYTGPCRRRFIPLRYDGPERRDPAETRPPVAAEAPAFPPVSRGLGRAGRLQLDVAGARGIAADRSVHRAQGALLDLVGQYLSARVHHTGIIVRAVRAGDVGDAGASARRLSDLARVFDFPETGEAAAALAATLADRANADRACHAAVRQFERAATVEEAHRTGLNLDACAAMLSTEPARATIRPPAWAPSERGDAPRSASGLSGDGSAGGRGA